MHYLYKITNILNNKIYIGQSIHPEKRWKKHIAYSKQENVPQYIHRTMAKRGVENFTFEVIASCKTQSDVDEIEIVVIKQYNSQNKDFGYNLKPGGNTSTPSEETIKKMSDSAKRRIIEKPHTVPSFWKGKHRSEETKEKIKIAIVGSKRSLESIQKQINTTKTRIENGEISPGVERGNIPWNKGVKKSK